MTGKVERLDDNLYNDEHGQPIQNGKQVKVGEEDDGELEVAGDDPVGD